ncbi:hypothetical protein [Streptomyces sp. NPDC004528]
MPSVEFAEYDQYAMDIRAGNRLLASRGKGVRSVRLIRVRGED